MSAPAAQVEPPVAASRYAPQVACLLVLFALVDSQVLGAIAAQIAAGLGAEETTVASGVTVYALFAAGVALGLAWYPRTHHPRRWLPLAAALFAGASLLTGLAPHVAVFLAGRALTGLAGGLISALAIAALANASSYEKRGSQMSWVAISYFLAPVLGVPLATFLTGFFGWRSAFLLNALFVAAAGLLVRLYPLASLVAADAETAEARPLGGRGLGGALGALWRLSTRSTSALMGIASAFFVSGGLVGFTAYLGIWLHGAFGAGPQGVGTLYAAAGAGAVAGGALGGRFADTFGKRRVAVLASLATAALLLVVPGFSWGAPLFALVAATAFAASLRVAPLQALVTELVPATERTTYIALRNASSQLGIAASVLAAGPAYERLGMMGVALLCAALTVVAWLALLLIEDPHDLRRAGAPRPRLALRVARRGVVAVVALALLVPLAAPWALSFLVTKARTRPDELNRPETPATYGAEYVEVSFASADGNRLSGWYLPHRGRPITIVMTHGLFRSRYELLARAVDLWELGYGVLLYDLRRHGKSPAEFSTLGFEERHDVAAALAFARERAPDARAVLFGISMGAAATLLAAAESGPVLAVVADSSFLSLDHTVAHHLGLAGIPTFPFAALLSGITAGRMGFRPTEFDVRGAVGRITAPILFIGSTGDRRMPVDTVLEPLYEAAASPLKRKMIVPDAGHGHAYEADPEAYVAAVNDFLHEAEGAAGAR